MSPWSTTLLLYLSNCGSDSAFLRWHNFINVAKCTLLLSLCAFRINSCFALDFVQLPSLDRFELFPFFVHCCLCIRNSHCLRHRNELVYQILWFLERYPLPAMWSSWPFSRDSSNRGLMDSWESTYKRSSFWNLLGCIKPRYSFLQVCQACCLLPARYGRVDMHFQLFPRILDAFFIFFVFRINKIYASHSSSIMEFWLLVCPLLLFTLLSGCPNFSPTSDRTWSGLVVVWTFVSLLPSHINPFGGFQQ